MSQPVLEWMVEVLEEQPSTIASEAGFGNEIIVEISNSTVIGEPAVPEIIEVAIVPPVGAGVRFIETVPFTRQGALSVTPTGTEFPVGPGLFILDTISARVTTEGTGSDIILDIKVNDVSIFIDPDDRPTIPDGMKNAVIGDFGSVMLVEGDYIEVTIEQVGSLTPGENLVVSIRLERVG